MNVYRGNVHKPELWQSYINAILSSIPDRQKYLAIMVDLLLQS